MTEYYSGIKLVHIVAVIASGSLFFLRGLGVQAKGQWAMSAPLRYLSYSIDTVLLVAALLLLFILPSAVYDNGWLTLKLCLLVVYIVLGTLALKRGRTARQRLACYVAALMTFFSMYAIARTHQPLGPFLYLQWILP